MSLPLGQSLAILQMLLDDLTKNYTSEEAGISVSLSLHFCILKKHDILHQQYTHQFQCISVQWKQASLVSSSSSCALLVVICNHASTIPIVFCCFYDVVVVVTIPIHYLRSSFIVLRCHPRLPFPLIFSVVIIFSTPRLFKCPKKIPCQFLICSFYNCQPQNKH